MCVKLDRPGQVPKISPGFDKSQALGSVSWATLKQRGILLSLRWTVGTLLTWPCSQKLFEHHINLLEMNLCSTSLCSSLLHNMLHWQKDSWVLTQCLLLFLCCRLQRVENYMFWSKCDALPVISRQKNTSTVGADQKNP